MKQLSSFGNGKLFSKLLVFAEVETWDDFDVFDAYVRAWDRGRPAVGTRHGRLLRPSEATAEATEATGLATCRLVAFHPQFARWLLPKRGNGSVIHIDLMQKRVFSDPGFPGEPAMMIDPAPEEIEVGPRQVCAQLLTGSGPCSWDLESLIPEEDCILLPDNELHRSPHPAIHLIRQVDLDGSNIITEANEL